MTELQFNLLSQKLNAIGKGLRAVLEDQLRVGEQIAELSKHLGNPHAVEKQRVSARNNYEAQDQLHTVFL